MSGGVQNTIFSTFSFHFTHPFTLFFRDFGVLGGPGQNPLRGRGGGGQKWGGARAQNALFWGGSKNAKNRRVKGWEKRKGVKKQGGSENAICARACKNVHFWTPLPGGVPGGSWGGPGGLRGSPRGCAGTWQGGPGGLPGARGEGGRGRLNASPSLLVEVGHSSRRTERPNDQPSICSVSFKTWSAIVGGD